MLFTHWTISKKIISTFDVTIKYIHRRPHTEGYYHAHPMQVCTHLKRENERELRKKKRKKVR